MSFHKQIKTKNANYKKNETHANKQISFRYLTLIFSKEVRWSHLYSTARCGSSQRESGGSLQFLHQFRSPPDTRTTCGRPRGWCSRPCWRRKYFWPPYSSLKGMAGDYISDHRVIFLTGPVVFSDWDKHTFHENGKQSENTAPMMSMISNV